MEGRFWLGIAILVLFLILGLLIAWMMQSIHTPAQASLQAAAQAALAGDYREAAALADQAAARWYASRRYTASVADHGPMDDVEALFAEMKVYAQVEDPHFTACCAQLQVLLKAIADAHAPAWWNFL